MGKDCSILLTYRIDNAAAQRFADPDQSLDTLRSLDWAGNPELATSLEESVTGSPGIGICYSSGVSNSHKL